MDQTSEYTSLDECGASVLSLALSTPAVVTLMTSLHLSSAIFFFLSIFSCVQNSDKAGCRNGWFVNYMAYHKLI